MKQALTPSARKTAIPTRRPDTITRPRLVAVLRSGLSRKLSVVTAPSGFGKTTLMAEVVEDLAVPVSWLTLDRWDRDPRELLADLAQALGHNGDLPDGGDSATPEGLRRQLRLLIWSDQRAEERIIIIDDFQLLEGSKEAVGLVDELLEVKPDGWHLVVASRELPALGNLARLITQGEALYLGMEDLSFDEDEVRRFFAEVRGEDISDGRVADVLSRTDGWAASIALLSQSHSSVESNRRGQMFLEELLNEAFLRQPTATRKFLLSASVLNGLDPAFCDELLQWKRSRKLLKELERKNIFVTRPDADASTYRFHPLFRRFLKDKLEAETPDEHSGLCETAGRLSEGRGCWAEALSYYAEARLWPEVIRVIRIAADGLLSYGRGMKLKEWLGRLPLQMLEQDAGLTLLRARACLDIGELDDALRTITDLLDGDCPEAVRGLALLNKGACLSRKGQHTDAIRTGRLAVSLLSEGGAGRSVQAEAHLRLGVALGESGQFARAVQPLRRAMALSDGIGDVLASSVAADALGGAFVNLGRISEAQSYFERARQGWAKLGNDYRLALTLNNLGVMYCWQGEHELSWQLLSEAVEKARSTGNPRVEAFATLSLGDVKRDIGDYDAALELYSDGLDRARRLGEAYFIDYAIDALGTTYMLRGDLKKAEVLIRQAATEVDRRGGVYQSGLVALSFGMLQRQRGDLASAEVQLETAVRLLKEASAPKDQARAHFHLADVHLSGGSRRRALVALQEVARLAGEMGYWAFLQVEARRCPALTAFAASKGIGNDLFRHLSRDRSGRGDSEGDGRSSIRPVYPLVEALGLGQTAVRIGGKMIADPDWSSIKSKEMLFYFLGNRQRVSRDECCAALWPDFDPARATSNFHSTLYRLRSATFFDVVSNEKGYYQLNPNASFRYDVSEFESLVQRAEGQGLQADERIATLERAVDTYAGPFACELYSDWAADLRRRLEDRYLRAVSVLARHYVDANAYERCLDACDRIIAVDEGNDEAHCLRVEVYLALGDRVSAVRHFESYRRLIREQSGSLLSERLSEVGRRIARGV